MAIMLFDLGVAVLAGFGVDAARRSVPRLIVLSLCGFAAILYFVSVALAMTAGSDLRRFSGLVLAAVVAVLLASLLYAWSRNHISGRAATTCLVLLLMLELGNLIGAGWTNRDQHWPGLEKMAENADIVQFLKAQAGYVRVDIDAQAIPFNFGDWHGVYQFGGYAGVTRNIIQIQSNYAARMLYGTNFYIGTKPFYDGQPQVYEGKSGLKVYQNAGAFPGAWSVHSAITVPDEKAIEVQLQRPLPELAHETFLTGSAPQLEKCAGDDIVNLALRAPNRIVVQADMRCRGMVVIGQTYFPGWVATVDEHPARIWEAYSTLQGVVVDTGRHRIELRYRPISVYIGAVLTGFGLLLALMAQTIGSRLSISSIYSRSSLGN
jgi:hypothetical protein